MYMFAQRPPFAQTPIGTLTLHSRHDIDDIKSTTQSGCYMPSNSHYLRDDIKANTSPGYLITCKVSLRARVGPPYPG